MVRPRRRFALGGGTRTSSRTFWATGPDGTFSTFAGSPAGPGGTATRRAGARALERTAGLAAPPPVITFGAPAFGSVTPAGAVALGRASPGRHQLGGNPGVGGTVKELNAVGVGTLGGTGRLDGNDGDAVKGEISFGSDHIA